MDSNSAWKPGANSIGTMTDTSSHGDFSWTSFFKIFAMVVETVAIVAVDVLSLGTLTEVAAPAEAAVVGEGIATGVEAATEATTAAAEATGTASKAVSWINRTRLSIGMTDKTAAGINLGIGIGGAAAQSGLDAADGDFSVLNLGIDIAAAIVPFGTDIRAGRKMLAKVVSNASVILKETERLGIKSGLKVDKAFITRLQTIPEIDATDLKYVKQRITKFHMTDEAKANPERSLTEFMVGAADKQDRNWATGLHNQHIGGSAAPERHIDAIIEGARSNMAAAEAGWATNQTTISALEALYHELSAGNFPENVSVFTSQSSLTAAFQKLNPNVKQSVFDMLFVSPRQLNKAEIAMRNAQKTMEDITSIFDNEQKTMLELIIQAAGNMRGFEVFAKASERHRNGSTWRKMFAQFDSTLTTSQRRRIGQRIYGRYLEADYDTTVFRNVIRVSKGLTTEWNAKRITRFLGSAKFNKYGVQLAQLIDPTDVGRYPVELLYQGFKKKFDKFVEKRFARSYEAAKKYARGTWKLEQAWKASGGTVIPRNRYILGFKVLNGRMGKTAATSAVKAATTHNLVLIKFNKINTGHKLSKRTITKMVNGGKVKRIVYKKRRREGRNSVNKNGKPDIMVRMTDKQLAEFEARGVVYWFEVGRRYGWFVSRGGRRVGTGYLQLSTKLSLFLSFIPVPALRNLLSVGSNWIENISAIGRGEWTEQWATKFLTSLERASINRSSRAMFRVVAGGLAKAWVRGLKKATKGYDVLKWLGNSAGRELQRYSSATVHLFETTNSKGQFKFKHPTKAQVVGRAFGLSISTSLQSAVRRKARKTHSRAAKIQSFRTKARQVRRIPGAITPNSVFQPRGLGSIKLK